MLLSYYYNPFVCWLDEEKMYLIQLYTEKKIIFYIKLYSLSRIEF